MLSDVRAGVVGFVRDPLRLTLLAIASVVFGWNAAYSTPLIGFDAPGHAGYALTIAAEGRLPHPLAGWSTFHPPLYHALGAVVWRLLEGASGGALLVALRAISALGITLASLVVYVLTRRATRLPAVAFTAGLLVLLVPVSQLSATMVGNEALGAGLAALALVPLQQLQRDPGCARTAVATGGLVGLALLAKFTGLFVACAALVPFARGDLDRRSLRALALLLISVLCLAGPIYARNLWLTGTALPMTREREPMRSVEAGYELRPRRLADYLTLGWQGVLSPSVALVERESGTVRLNPGMQRVWALVYASFWYDPFHARIPLRLRYAGVDPWGGLLLALGLVPTLLMLRGLAGAAGDALRTRGRAPDAPLVLMSAAALAAFVAFTWRAPSLVAAKGSYLLPLLAPAGLFFARGAASLAPRARTLALAASCLAAATSGVVLASGLLFPRDEPAAVARGWLDAGAQLPGSHIPEAVLRLVSP